MNFIEKLTNPKFLNYSSNRTPFCRLQFSIDAMKYEMVGYYLENELVFRNIVHLSDHFCSVCDKGNKAGFECVLSQDKLLVANKFCTHPDIRFLLRNTPFIRLWKEMNRF